jgi:hypothetical protein
LGGEAQKIRFHLGGDPPEPQGPEPPGVGVWGLVVHVLLMIPLVPSAIVNAIVTISAVASFARALRSPAHRAIVTGGAVPTSALLLALFLVVMVAGLALLSWVLVLLARAVLDHRLWHFVLLCSLGMLALGVGVWVLTAAGAPATATVFGVYGYVAAIAVGHLLWPHHRVPQ